MSQLELYDYRSPGIVPVLAPICRQKERKTRSPFATKVSFYASFEVDQHIESIRRSRDAEGGTSCDNLLAILSWCLANTAQGIADNLPYWAAQGVNRFQKKKAYLEYNCSLVLPQMKFHL